MNSELLIILLLLCSAIVMLALNKPRVDAVALIMMVLLPFTGVVSMDEAITGFSNPNIVLIAAMFVVGESLARTGVAQRVGDWLAIGGAASVRRLLVLLMLTVGLLGSVMSSTGVVAIFIPVVLRIASRTGIPASQLMMPMAYAALISGMMTLVATSCNLVINYELVASGADGFGFFAFTPFGLPILATGILYMLVAHRCHHPVNRTPPQSREGTAARHAGDLPAGRRHPVARHRPAGQRGAGDARTVRCRPAAPHRHLLHRQDAARRPGGGDAA